MVPFTVTSTACPGFGWLGTTNTGGMDLKLTDVPQSLRVSSPGYVPVWLAGFKPPTGARSGVLVKPTDKVSWLTATGWVRADEALIVMGMGAVNPSGAPLTAPCDSATGTKLAVAGHPEAIVKYDVDGTYTAPSFVNGKFAAIRLVPKSPGEIVTITGTKPSCVIFAAHYFYTGATYVERGAVSDSVAFVGNP